MRNLFIRISLCLILSFSVQAATFEYSKAWDVLMWQSKGIEIHPAHELKVTINDSQISMSGNLSAPWSFQETAALCSSGKKAKISLIKLDVTDIAWDRPSWHYVAFISYLIECPDESRVKYIAVDNVIKYSLYGDAIIASADVDWAELRQREFTPAADENLKKNSQLLEYMIATWPKQAIIIR